MAHDLPAEKRSAVTPLALNKLSVKSTGWAQAPCNFRAPDSPIADLRVRPALRLGVDGAGKIAALLPEVASPSISPAAERIDKCAESDGFVISKRAAISPAERGPAER